MRGGAQDIRAKNERMESQKLFLHHGAEEPEIVFAPMGGVRAGGGLELERAGERRVRVAELPAQALGLAEVDEHRDLVRLKDRRKFGIFDANF